MIVEVEHVKNWEQVLLISLLLELSKREIAAEAVISGACLCLSLLLPFLSCFVFTGNTKSFVVLERAFGEKL